MSFNDVKDGSNYQAWKWDYRQGKNLKTIDQVIKYCVSAGILAANIHNTQPWQFKIGENVIKIHPKWQLRLPQADPTGRNLFISLGCCVANIEVAAAFANYDTSVITHGVNLKNAYISIAFKKRTSMSSLGDLSKYITQRFSNKFAYENIPIPLPVQRKFFNFTLDGVSLKLSDDPNIIKKTAQLTKEAIVDLARKNKFGKELSTWLRPGDTLLKDGMPGFVVGLSNFQARIGKIVLHHIPKSLIILAKKDYELLCSSPMIGIIVSSHEKPSSFVNAGRLYELFALKAFSLGIHSAIMHAVIENSITKDKLSDSFEIKDKKTIQLLFRLGYSKTSGYHTPRFLLNTV